MSRAPIVNRKLRLDLTRAFLLQRGWGMVRSGKRFDQLQAPEELGLGSSFVLTLPGEDHSADSELVLDRLLVSLADIYEYSLDQLSLILSLPDTVVSIQVQNEATKHGSLPFLIFDGLIEKLKKTLLDMASFVITDSPIVDEIPTEAQRYLSRCNFLQTEIGSYVAKIQLPAQQQLTDPTFFNPQGITTDAVNNRLADVLAFVAGPILTGGIDTSINPLESDSATLINVSVIKDIADLFERTAADELNFTFLSATQHRVVRTGQLTDEKFDRLHAYIDFAREIVAADFGIDVVGKIVELRSRNRDSKRNYVGVATVWQGREVFVTLVLNRADYYYAVQAHQRNNPVRVVGKARRMRTQIRVIKVSVFEEIERKNS